jgi:hypothetical protein
MGDGTYNQASGLQAASWMLLRRTLPDMTGTQVEKANSGACQRCAYNLDPAYVPLIRNHDHAERARLALTSASHILAATLHTASSTLFRRLHHHHAVSYTLPSRYDADRLVSFVCCWTLVCTSRRAGNTDAYALGGARRTHAHGYSTGHCRSTAVCSSSTTRFEPRWPGWGHRHPQQLRH